MAYPPVPGWLPPPSAKLQSTWLSGRARLSTVSSSRYYQSETFEWRRHFSTAASISRRNDGAFLQRVATAVTSEVQSLYRFTCITAVPAMEPIFRDQDTACLAMVGLRGQLKDDVVYSSLSLTTIPEREYG